MKAETYGEDTGAEEEIIPTAEESAVVEKISNVWSAILKCDVTGRVKKNCQIA